MSKKLLGLASVFFKGVAMGCADVVPGVSGGTIALITGVYDRLIYAIKSVNLEALKLLKNGHFKELWKHIDGNFLVALVGGILISLYTLANVITFLISEYPIQLWSFFFGLIIISSLMVLRELQERNLPNILMVILGAIIAFFITSASPAETPDGLWFIFITGAVAICAMILPGISGAFILLIMGKYYEVLEGLKALDIAMIVVFGLGCVFGLLAFSRVISWFLMHYKDKTIAMLAGFMIGALNEIWPWKLVKTFRMNSKGEQVPFIKENVWPNVFAEQTAKEPYLLEALFFMALGIVLVIAIERIGKMIRERNQI